MSDAAMTEKTAPETTAPRTAAGQEAVVDKETQSPVGTASTTDDTAAAPVPKAPASNHSRDSQNSTPSTLAPETETGPVPPSEKKGVGAAKHPREGWPKWKWPLVAFLNCIFFLLIGSSPSPATIDMYVILEG